MEKRKRIGLYSPYVPKHIGGGERYFFSVAEILSKKHDVEVLVHDTNLSEDVMRKRYEQAFHLDLSQVRFVQTSIGTHASFFKKLIETLRFDVLYYLTDGSLFFSLARKNILHIQFPFTFPIEGFVSRLKLLNWGIRNANSMFTKQTVERAWKIKIPYVHYPYVDTSMFVPLKKEHIILSVGRFFSAQKSGLHCKRQDIMVLAFKRMVDEGLNKDWKLVLLGSIDPGKDNEDYAKEVAKAAKGYPIKILHEASFEVLLQYYGHASIYWHAAGFDVDEYAEPKRVEHFGISTIEAMSSGEVPVVIGKGGLKEIVMDGEDGYLWQTEQDLIEKTSMLISDPKMVEKLQSRAKTRAEVFNKQQFQKKLEEMVA